VVYNAACGLLEGVFAKTGLGTGTEMVRLIGVGVSSLVANSALEASGTNLSPGKVDSPGGARTLFELDHDLPTERNEHRTLDASMDDIRKRFGFNAISFGNSLALRDADDSWRAVEMRDE